MNKPERRNAAETAGVTSTAPEVSKRKRTKNYNPVAGYRITPELADQIKQLADDLKVSTSDLAEVFFKYALEAYKKGDLKLERTPEKYSISIK